MGLALPDGVDQPRRPCRPQFARQGARRLCRAQTAFGATVKIISGDDALGDHIVSGQQNSAFETVGHRLGEIDRKRGRVSSTGHKAKLVLIAESRGEDV